MLSSILQLIFVPKRARQRLAAQGKSARRATAQPSVAGGREKLLDDALAVYRQQRQDVYDSLDDATRRQIEEDAEKAFGRALHTKS